MAQMAYTPENFGLSKEDFEHMVKVNDAKANSLLSRLATMYEAALADEEAPIDERLRHAQRLGFVRGILFERLGFGDSET